ncbi:FKBP-type peptidyl prolyl cis-trans isomerase /apo-metallochaperone SlyD [Alkalispirillum mobile]|uniref:Peptidyl-prolyl cis-trans isomerase n=1 Tax=Alkalispirillum mobile TaxID=85925 RepID=A0A498CGT0_9GAMM|nr:peptidylprolyl isomerase [Alkalispirillum mobile]RLK51538.1 FKBP-type peptidyl prolyl cis-trans isomerase /apo-metallochaperone SlyD [Alkalispirillum mobile]
MKIRKNTVVTVDYRLKDEDGTLLDDSQQSGPMVYLHGYKHILPALEEALEGIEEGMPHRVTLAPEQAYGPRQENLVFEANREFLPEDLELYEGQQLTSGSHGRRFTLKVVRLTENGAVLDGNHPLAGRQLTFEVQIREVRPATKDEVRAQYARDATAKGQHAASS